MTSSVPLPMNRHRFIGSGIPAGVRRARERGGPRTGAATMDVARRAVAINRTVRGCQGVETSCGAIGKAARGPMHHIRPLFSRICPSTVTEPYFSTGVLGQYSPGHDKRQVYGALWRLTRAGCYVHPSERMHADVHARARRWLHLVAQATRITGASRPHCCTRDLQRLAAMALRRLPWHSPHSDPLPGQHVPAASGIQGAFHSLPLFGALVRRGERQAAGAAKRPRGCATLSDRGPTRFVWSTRSVSRSEPSSITGWSAHRRWTRCATR
jgi:hypothetical protein